MAHSLSAKKRIRQNEKRRARNRARKDQLKGVTKDFLGSVTKNDVAGAEAALNKVVQKLDRFATKNTIHKNAAARKRSRLTKKLNALKSGVAGTKVVSA